VNLILAQRLSRKNCAECREIEEVAPQVLMDAGVPETDVPNFKPMKGKGCKTCNSTGFKGRIALYEVMPLFDDMKECVLQGYSAMELKREAMRMGMKTLRRAGLGKIQEGMCCLQEVCRVTRGD
jgi:type IV pilus assembly protein PilB